MIIEKLKERGIFRIEAESEIVLTRRGAERKNAPRGAVSGIQRFNKLIRHVSLINLGI